MIRKAGLDPDTVLLKTARLVEQRDLTRWLPLALASIYGLICAYGSSNPPSIHQTLRLWGLTIDADDLEEMSERYEEMKVDKALSAFFGKGVNGSRQ